MGAFLGILRKGILKFWEREPVLYNCFNTLAETQESQRNCREAVRSY